jgi:hypothetical protein
MFSLHMATKHAAVEQEVRAIWLADKARVARQGHYQLLDIKSHGTQIIE